MVLFDEDPVTLIRETTNQFHIPPDRESLTRIHTSLHSLASARSARLHKQTTTLAALSRRLHALRGQRDYEAERHDAGRHVADMLAMDAAKFKLAKGVCDAEIEAERLAGERSALKVQLETLDKEGVEGGGGGGSGKRAEVSAQDGTVLRLQFYRSLGIDATQDATTGEYTRAVVQCPERGDVNVINVDHTMSSSFYAKMIWDSL